MGFGRNPGRGLIFIEGNGIFQVPNKRLAVGTILKVFLYHTASRGIHILAEVIAEIDKNIFAGAFRFSFHDPINSDN